MRILLGWQVFVYIFLIITFVEIMLSAIRKDFLVIVWL